MAEILGAGATLTYQVGTATAVAITNIFSMSATSEFGTVEATNLGDTVKRYKPTILEPGELSFEAYYDGSGHDTLIGLQGQTLTWALTTTGPNVFTASGILTKAELNSIENESLVVLSCTVKRTGAITAS